ncbi:MAG TPA: FtsX-like permease family protein [Candidatus Binataceae bacterium]|nr:FtsX-like permease family protein [Candidatus Binataceae bacterium]
MKYAPFVIKSLLRSKRRTVLTVLSIAVSLFIFSGLVSLPALAGQILAATASSLRVACHAKAGVTYAIPEAYQQRIAVTPHVAVVVAESWFGGVYHDVSDQFPNLAVDAEQAEAMWPDWGVSDEAWKRFRSLRTACLIGASTMKRFKLHVGQQIMLRGTLYPFNLTLNIVGVMGGKAPPNFLIFRRDYLREAAGQPGYVDAYWVRVDRAENVAQVIAGLDEQFSNSSAPTRSESEAAFYGGFLQSSRTMFQLMEILGFIVVVTIGLVAANTAAMSIRERRSEIAVMRSMGFPSRTILGLLLAESLLIGLAGGVLGCTTAYLLLKFLFVEAPTMVGFGAIRIPPSIVGETLAIAALIGLLSAYVPARSAARRNIVDALRAVA